MNNKRKIYELNLKEYNELFQVKYSFYGLMRRFYSWFKRNEADDVGDSFAEFKNNVAGWFGNEFNQNYQFMFFSDDFILDTFYGLIPRNIKFRGLTQKYEEREAKIELEFRKLFSEEELEKLQRTIYVCAKKGLTRADIVKEISLTESFVDDNDEIICIIDYLVKQCLSRLKNAKEPYSVDELYKLAIREYHNVIGLRRTDTGNVDSTFVKVSSNNAEIPNKYFGVISNPEQRKIEEQRIIELVKRWFPEKYVQVIIDDVIEEEYLNRYWVPARWKNAENQCGGEKGLPEYFCVKDSFYSSVAALFDLSYKCDVYYGMTLDRLCDLLNYTEDKKVQIIDNQERHLRVVEEKLQDLLDCVKKENKVLVEDNEYGVVIDQRKGEKKHDEYRYTASTALEKRFNSIKNEDPYRFIAKIIMTSLCTHNVKEALLHIWDISEFSQEKIGIGTNSYEKLISDLTFPFVTNEDRCKCITKLAGFDSNIPFYDSESEYCFLNIYLYENWEILKGNFKNIDNPIVLLENTYSHLEKMEAQERQDYYRKYEDVYIKNSLRKALLTLIQFMIEDESTDYYMFEELVIFANEIIRDNEIKVLESKMRMLDIWPEESVYCKDYAYACEELIEIYKETKEESLITPINKCLSELNDDVEITGIAVKELRNIWTKIGAQNGDQEEIRRLYSEYCSSKLLERKEKIKKEKKLDFSEISKTNYQEYAINEAKRDIFVVLGYGRASETFIKSIKNQEECVIYVVPQKNEIIESSVPSYVEIINDGFDSIYKNLPVYNLDIEYLEDENAFKEYVKHISRIHLIALGDDKRENVRNVVDFIEVTWQHYVLYEYMLKICSNIDFKIDFKEVDIVVDAYDYETSYIDSIMNRLDNDFYIRINYVNYRKEVAKELLTEFPLFLADMQEKKLEFKIDNPTSRDDTQDNEFVPGETKHNVVLLGDVQKLDEILEVIKGVIRVAGYSVIGNDLGEYSEKNASVYEGKIGENYRLTIISEDSDVIKERLMYEAPDLFECTNRTYLHNVEPMFINLNPKGYRFLKLFDEIKKMECIDNQNANKKQLKKEVSDNNPIGERIDLSNIKYLLDEIQKEKQEIISYNKELEVNQFECEVSEILREATYFICMLKDDVVSYEIATKIRQACYRMDKSMKHVPIIAALCENGYSDTDYNSFVVGIDEEKPIKYKDPWWRRYDIFSFGSFDKCYSYANLYDNYLSKIAWKMHVTDKEGYDYEKKVRAYYKNHYNFKACEERAITIPYVFYSILCEEMCKDCSLRGFFDGLDNHWSMDVFEKNIDRYIELYKERILVKDSNGKYTDSFASNAILWLAVLEKNRFNVNLTLDGYTSAINGVENKSLFEEYIHGWKNRDVENSLGSKLHIAKLHGDITTWESSSGKEYDSKYVRDLGTYLERDVLGNTLLMGKSSRDNTRNEGKTK